VSFRERRIVRERTTVLRFAGIDAELDRATIAGRRAEEVSPIGDRRLPMARRIPAIKDRNLDKSWISRAKS
jgi:hypothetical protein